MYLVLLKSYLRGENKQTENNNITIFENKKIAYLIKDELIEKKSLPKVIDIKTCLRLFPLIRFLQRIKSDKIKTWLSNMKISDFLHV